MNIEMSIDETYRKNWEYLVERCFDKDLECEICGYNKFSMAIDFHFIDPDIEDFAFASLWEYNPKWLELKEIIKMMAESQHLCFNCHDKIHEELGIEPFEFY